MEPDRYSVFDYAKALGIALVVYGHVARGIYKAGLPINQGFFEIVDRVIYSFHMPLFFLMSGFFFIGSLEKRGVAGLLVEKINTVAYPYVLWSLIQGAVEVFLASYTNGDAHINDVFSLLWLPRAQFWFLYVLFFFFVFSSFLYRAADFYRSSVIFFVSLFLFCFSESDFYIVGAFKSFFVYFALGVLFSFLRIGCFSHGRWGFVVVLFFLVANLFFYDRALLFLGSYVSVWYFCLAILGIGTVFFVSFILQKYQVSWIRLFGSYSLEIYLLHILVGSGVRIVIRGLFGVDDVFVHLILGTFLGLVFPLAFAYFARRFGYRLFFVGPFAN